VFRQLIELESSFPTPALIISQKDEVHFVSANQLLQFDPRNHCNPKVSSSRAISILLTFQCCKIPYFCSLMATLFHFPTFLSLSSRKLFLAPQQEQYRLIWVTQEHPPQRRFTVCACSNKKPRFEFLCFVFLYFCNPHNTSFDGFLFTWLFIFIYGWFRGSRKVKSSAELCNDIREFVTAFGLPEDHVPSLKELLQHGRFLNSYYLFLLLISWFGG
jgi:hypothetical protein